MYSYTSMFNFLFIVILIFALETWRAPGSLPEGWGLLRCDALVIISLFMCIYVYVYIYIYICICIYIYIYIYTHVDVWRLHAKHIACARIARLVETDVIIPTSD